MTDEQRLPDPRMIPVRHPRTWSEPHEPSPSAPRSDGGSSSQPGEFVRPFIMTGGRTTPLTDGLRVETQVQATPAAMFAPLQFELYTAVRLCQQPQSIAELAARLEVPIGVARVIVGDLVQAGHAVARQTDEVQTSVIERIRDLVREL